MFLELSRNSDHILCRFTGSRPQVFRRVTKFTKNTCNGVLFFAKLQTWAFGFTKYRTQLRALALQWVLINFSVLPMQTTSGRLFLKIWDPLLSFHWLLPLLFPPYQILHIPKIKKSLLGASKLKFIIRTYNVFFCVTCNS